MTKAGVIGLGAIGSGVAICLARADKLGPVYDVRPNACEGLPGVPSMSASPAKVARQTNVVIIAVVNADQVLDVLQGPNGVLSAARPDLTIVLVSTVAIEALRNIRAIVNAAGVSLVDCGVTGGSQARNNGLVCLVGADPELFEKVRPTLEGFAKSIYLMGGPNAGMAGKIARNTVVFGAARAGYEGAALARAAGVDLKQLMDVMRDSAEGVGGPMLFMGMPDSSQSAEDAAKRKEFLRALMVKDLDAALDLGKALGVELPLIQLTKDTDRQVVGITP